MPERDNAFWRPGTAWLLCAQAIDPAQYFQIELGVAAKVVVHAFAAIDQVRQNIVDIFNLVPTGTKVIVLKNAPRLDDELRSGPRKRKGLFFTLGTGINWANCCELGYFLTPEIFIAVA